MKRTSKRWIATLLFFCLFIETAFSQNIATVTAVSLILRQNASFEANAIMAIPEGENVEVLSENGDWIGVRYANQEGFVMRKYLNMSNVQTNNIQAYSTQAPQAVSAQKTFTIVGTSIAATVRPGEKGDTVMELQAALQSLGFYEGKLDGDYGNGTELAVKAFQKSKKLEEDGIAGQATLTLIFADIAALNTVNATNQNTQTNNVVATIPSDTVRPGSKGDEVVAIQQALSTLGYYKGSLDGDYGKATEEAVKKFQKNRKLSTDGVAGPGTLSALFGKNFVANTTTNTPTPQGTTYPKVNSLAEINGVPSPVYPGETNEDVVKLQQALTVLGYYKNTIDGNYGKSTESAVKAFQKKRGLSSDGIAGQGTIATIFGVSKTKIQTSTTSQAPISTNNTIEIYTIEDIGDTPKTSKPGDTGTDVIKLQQALYLANVYKGSFDGNYGEGTQNAVKAFQKKRGMNADGIAGPATIKYLFGSPAANASTYQSVVAGNKNNNSDTVNIIESIEDIGETPDTSRPGDSGTNVIKLQQALYVLHFYKGSIHGQYDEATQNAVKAFQKKRGMSADGIAGNSTIRIMFGEPAHKAAQAEENAKNTQNTQNLAGIDTIQDIGLPTAAVHPGESGENVKKLQQALSLLGYYSGTIDGNYGEGTQNAVKAFQKKRGMGQDGIAGNSTLRLIFGKAPASNPKAESTKNNTKAEPAQDPAMKGINTIADIGAIPKTSKPGNHTEDVKKLQQALTLLGYFDDTVDGKYGESTKQAVTRFQKKKGMNADGIAGSSTIRLIFGKAPQNTNKTTANNKDKTKSKVIKKEYTTELLNWARTPNVIPKNAVFEVQDARTGQIFKAKRWSGANHIDAEPLTAQDTKLIKSFYGGFTWMRRAILVKYNNKVYAASMNFMPHGTGLIKNNNFDGHFCIHILNSTTHGSKKVDTEHQNMVKKALKYTW